MNLTTPKAIIIGLSLIALVVLFQPTTTQLLVTPAHAQSSELSRTDHKMFADGFYHIAKAIEGIRACR